MGEQIPNTTMKKYWPHIYETQKQVDKGIMDKKYLIPNTTLTIILANRKKTQKNGKKGTMEEQIPNT